MQIREKLKRLYSETVRALEEINFSSDLLLWLHVRISLRIAELICFLCRFRFDVRLRFDMVRFAIDFF